MVENVNNGNVGKIWTKIRNATSDSKYLKGLDAKINSVMQGESTVSTEKIMNDSVFANMDEKTRIRFNKIAGLDGNAKSFTRDELRILYALADAKLVDNKFEFDLKWDNTEQSALKEAKSEANIGGEAIGEMEVVVDNLTADNSTARHIKIVNTSEFDKSKPLAEKLKSENPDEVMTAINNEIMTDYVNPLTGKKMPITEIASFVLRYTRENPLMGKDEIAGNIQKEYGIPINYTSSDKNGPYTVGDWKIDKSGISNEKTGQRLTGKLARWESNTFESIPNVNGYIFMIDTYSDKNGNVIKFKTQNEVDTIQPSGATVYGPNGAVQQIKYDIEETVDPSVYGFVPKE